jgi:predicted outer membrane protein
MSLTQTKIKELEAKGFDKLYTDHKPLWDGLAANAKKYAKDHITGGADPRLDDILKMLLPMIESLDELRDHQEEVQARAPRFQTFFAEYIIDKNATGVK